jgi:hypothetical protein
MSRARSTKPSGFFSFRPTPADARLMRKYARETGLTMSELLRRTIRIAGPVLVKRWKSLEASLS